MIEIDGSWGEGGGQLVRTAVALAAINGAAIRVLNVRARRGKPGLAPQHLAAVRAVATICDAQTENLELGASAFTFSPRELKGGEFRFEIGTAGSITLVLQALLPALVASRKRARVTVGGGSDVRQAPPVDYLAAVMLRHLARMGAPTTFTVERRGYYPRGGGEVSIEIEPCALQPIKRSVPGALEQLKGISHVANLPAHIAERMRGAAIAQLPAFADRTNIAVRVLGDREATGRGGAIVAWAETEHTVLGAARVAEIGVSAETLGAAVGRELRADIESGATVDAHAADQLLVYLALAGPGSSFTTRELTSHAQTAIWLIGRFLPVHFVTEREGGLYRISTVA